MKMSEMYPSRFLKAEDFAEDERKTFTIKSVDLEELGQGKKETKPVVSFRDSEKGLVLNKTNGAVVAEMYGDDTDEWTGKKITLITLEVDSFGDVVRAIRISKTKPVAAPPAPSAESPNKKHPVVKTGKWQSALKRIGTSTYYQDNGGVDTWHILGVAAKLGYTEITDANIEEVEGMIVRYAVENTEAQQA